MELRLFNTLTKEKEVFAPLDPVRGVRMYVCGPTVYDFAHIGNARPVIVFDVLYRLLRHLYGTDKVKYVRNITDVDDKINARAAEEYPNLPLNEAIRLVTEKTEKQFHEDVDALGCLRPDVEPRATEHIAEMRELIERLVKAGFAYVEQEHVLFEVGKMADYGKLARRSLDEMEAGARVEVAPYKRNPMDFVLWKPSKPNEPGWPSPSGIATPGRPGWHIECSAMSWKHLGETFDIHGGGIDLVFPHHENELAQSRCAFHAPIMAKTWMHNGFLQVEGEKMSKSLGNFVTIRELLRGKWGKSWAGGVLKLTMIQTHYRQPIDWTRDKLEKTELELSSLANKFLEVAEGHFSNNSRRFEEWLVNVSEPIPEKFLRLLLDDLNTAAAINWLRSLFSSVNKDLKSAGTVLACLELVGVINRKSLFLHAAPLMLGVQHFDSIKLKEFHETGRKLQIALLNQDNQGLEDATNSLVAAGIRPSFQVGGLTYLNFENKKPSDSSNQIDRLIKLRNEARSRKDWEESDRIRDKLKIMGVVIKDNKDGTTTWEIAR